MKGFPNAITHTHTHTYTYTHTHTHTHTHGLEFFLASETICVIFRLEKK